MTKLLKVLLIVLIAQIGRPQQVQSCTIFIANDGKNVWIGNNEDDSPSKNYRLWFVPAKMKKENGVWFCTLTIPKGAHQYKFIVEDVWMTDPKNGLLAIEKKNVNSKLIVW